MYKVLFKKFKWHSDALKYAHTLWFVPLYCIKAPKGGRAWYSFGGHNWLSNIFSRRELGKL